MGAQHAGEVVVGELAALVGVEDLWPSLAQCVLQGFDAEARIEQIRQTPGQHVAAHPVHHRNQVEKLARHGNVGDIGRPHLADPLNPEPAQKVRIAPILLCRSTSTWALVDGYQSHPLHQALHPLAIHRMALCLKPRCHPPRTIEWSPQIPTIDQRHQFQFLRAGFDRPIIECGAAQPQQFALPAERKRALALDHRKPPFPPYSSDLRNKKSRSTISLPTCSHSSASLRSLTSSVRSRGPAKTLGAAFISAFFQA
jgi:hypothetical protein